MDSAFGHLYLKNVKTYIDDIIIMADSTEELLSLLTEVLEAARVANLPVKLKKCTFFHSEVEYLGNLVGKNGLTPSPKRVKDLNDILPPKNKDEIRSFMGSIQYVKSYIPSLSTIAAPIQALLKKNVPFIWADDCQFAYETLLQALKSAVYLSPPCGDGPYVLLTDASAYGVGACLQQFVDNELRLIGFYSATLSTQQRKWDTREREAYAIKGSGI
eukprot:GHVH01014295.1.p1 GENE.GHVH01014295.1~~GHVH01014295.1.p1  ORF type:complete len:216 (-),score=29.55 GHVH01014295.1:1127-1774(-)